MTTINSVLGLIHQHGHRFIVLEHQYGCRDVMWKCSIGNIERAFRNAISPSATEFFKFSHLFLSLLQNYLFVAPSVEIKFCCQSCDVIFPPKTVRLLGIQSSTILASCLPTVRIFRVSARVSRYSGNIALGSGWVEDLVEPPLLKVQFLIKVGVVSTRVRSINSGFINWVDKVSFPPQLFNVQGWRTSVFSEQRYTRSREKKKNK